jgi:hypothetical protein
MSSSTNCEVKVSHVVSMIVIVPPHDSCTTVSTPGRPGCHMEASERRSRSRSNMRNAAVSTIDATFVTSIAMTTAALRLPFSGRIRVTKQEPSGSKPQEGAKAKIDACGIGKCETRHPRWERCRAL